MCGGGLHGQESMHGRGHMHCRVCVCGKGDMHGREACMIGGMCARGHAWQHALQETCMVGVYVAREMATAADGMRPAGIHSYTLLLTC